MKTLKEYLNEHSLTEGILDVEDNLDKDYIKTQIEDFINKNYKVKGELKMNSVNGIYIVDCTNNVIVKNRDIESLTNGLFEWGEVDGFFSCSYCDKLQSLEGAPEKVNGFFNCSYCDKLQSLEGAPEKVNRDFYCLGCKKQFTKEDVEKVCKVKRSIQI